MRRSGQGPGRGTSDTSLSRHHGADPRLVRARNRSTIKRPVDRGTDPRDPWADLLDPGRRQRTSQQSAAGTFAHGPRRATASPPVPGRSDSTLAHHSLQRPSRRFAGERNLDRTGSPRNTGAGERGHVLHPRSASRRRGLPADGVLGRLGVRQAETVTVLDDVSGHTPHEVSSHDQQVSPGAGLEEGASGLR